MTETKHVDCSHCESRHPERYLCDPAAALLKALKSHADLANLPTIEFDDTIDMPVGQAILVGSLTAKAVLVPILGVERPGVMLHPKGVSGRDIPPLLYIGTRDDVTAFAQLITDVADLAVRHAEQANR